MAELTEDDQHEHYEVIVFYPNGNYVKKFPTEEKAQRYAARPEVAEWHPLLNHVITTVVTELIPLPSTSPGDGR